MVLSSFHPGISIEKIQQETGWRLKLAEEVRETKAPSIEELAAVRKYYPKGVWTS